YLFRPSLCARIGVLFYIVPLFFFTVAAPTEIYPLSLHDGSSDLITLSASSQSSAFRCTRLSTGSFSRASRYWVRVKNGCLLVRRSEEHTSELQSRENLVCRLLLEKKKKKYDDIATFGASQNIRVR